MLFLQRRALAQGGGTRKNQVSTKASRITPSPTQLIVTDEALKPAMNGRVRRLSAPVRNEVSFVLVAAESELAPVVDLLRQGPA